MKSASVGSHDDMGKQQSQDLASGGLNLPFQGAFKLQWICNKFASQRTAGVSEDDFRDRNLEVVAEPRAKVDGPAAPLGLPQQNLGGDAAAEPGRQRTVSAEAWRALPAAVDALLRTKQAVVNLDAVR